MNIFYKEVMIIFILINLIIHNCVEIGIHLLIMNGIKYNYILVRDIPSVRYKYHYNQYQGISWRFHIINGSTLFVIVCFFIISIMN